MDEAVRGRGGAARVSLPVLATRAPAKAAASGGDDSSGSFEDGPLVDRQQRVVTYLRVSVTDRCNYRCTYCLPDGVEHAARTDVLSFEEIVGLVRCFVRIGVRSVRLTGGEPTVRRDLPTLVRMLKSIAGLEDLALSTNGERLVELAGPLRDAGLDRLNVSLDSLDPQRFRRITGTGDVDRVVAGIDAARAAGFSDIKLNTVAIAGFNDDELGPLCAFAFERALVPRFIELMPMADGRLWVPGTLLAASAIRAIVARSFPAHRLLDGSPETVRGSGPARYFTLEPQDSTGAPARRFGIISAITEHFCSTCNRVRLSSTGALHACLAHDDAVDLRSPFRAGGEAAVVATLRGALLGKRDGHEFDATGAGGPHKAMIQIGG